MKIVHWSDFNCPNSYIGLNRIIKAVNELDLEFEWEMKAFELEPQLSAKESIPTITRYAVKYQLTTQDAKREINELEEIARDEGLHLNYKDTQLTNSRDAHRLVKYAQKNNPEKSLELICEIFKANFSKNQKISDHQILTDIAVSCGFNKKEIKNILSSDSYDVEVSLDEEDARFNGLYSIPFYIIMVNEDQLSVPGAFEKEDFKIAIKDMISGEINQKTFI